MFSLQKTISVLALVLGLSLFATQIQAAPNLFAKAQQIPTSTQQIQLLESSSVTNHYFSAIQSSGQKNSNPSQSPSLGTKRQSMLGVMEGIGELVIGFGIAVGAFSFAEIVIAAGLGFGEDQKYWSDLGQTVYLAGSILWGVAFAISALVTLDGMEFRGANVTGVIGAVFGIHLLAYKYSKSVHAQVTNVRVSPWIDPSDGSKISGGLAFSGNF